MACRCKAGWRLSMQGPFAGRCKGPSACRCEGLTLVGAKSYRLSVRGYTLTTMITRSTKVRWLAGASCFLLPAVIAVIASYLDQSPVRHDPRYVGAIPWVVTTSVAIATIVPGVLIARSSMSFARRVGAICATLFLLAVECSAVVYMVLMAGLG